MINNKDLFGDSFLFFFNFQKFVFRNINKKQFYSLVEIKKF